MVRRKWRNISVAAEYRLLMPVITTISGTLLKNATIAPLHAVPTRRIRDEMPKWGVISFQQNNRTVKHRGSVH